MLCVYSSIPYCICNAYMSYPRDTDSVTPSPFYGTQINIMTGWTRYTLCISNTITQLLGKNGRGTKYLKKGN